VIVAGHADRALPVGRSKVVEDGRLAGVVLDIDATEDPQALAVVQAPLHDAPEDRRLVFGYDLSVVGLGAWVGDRRARLLVWPALVDDAGEIEADDPDDPDADVLVVDIDPLEHGEALEALARIGRLFIAGPEAGPTPLVLDVDRALVAEVLEQLRAT
jgi:hypothetical protein